MIKNQYNYVPCWVCGGKAVWSYMAGFEHYCEKHVPRGCSCNMELKEGIDYDSPEAENPDNYIEKLDEKGRRLPCVEYFEIPLDFHNDKEYIDLVLKSYEDEDEGWNLWDFSKYE